MLHSCLSILIHFDTCMHLPSFTTNSLSKFDFFGARLGAFDIWILDHVPRSWAKASGWEMVNWMMSTGVAVHVLGSAKMFGLTLNIPQHLPTSLNTSQHASTPNPSKLRKDQKALGFWVVMPPKICR